MEIFQIVERKEKIFDFIVYRSSLILLSICIGRSWVHKIIKG
jgi:hypothetical protein